MLRRTRSWRWFLARAEWLDPVDRTVRPPMGGKVRHPVAWPAPGASALLPNPLVWADGAVRPAGPEAPASEGAGAPACPPRPAPLRPCRSVAPRPWMRHDPAGLPAGLTV